MAPNDAYLSDEGIAWMSKCHRQEDVVRDVGKRLYKRIQRVRDMGALYGQDPGQPIKKLEGFDNLWESRVHHSTGWYRQFFRFTTIGGRRAVIFVDGAVKKGADLPRHILAAADRRLDAYQSALEADLRLRETDRINP